MQQALLFAAPALSFLLLGLHYLRSGSWVMSAACVVLALSLSWRRPWVARWLQAALALGALEWAWTAVDLVGQRMTEGRPWGRMAIILGIVALLTAASIAAVEALRRRSAARA